MSFRATGGTPSPEQITADADRLADIPAVQAAAAIGIDLEGERTLSIGWNAYETATGTELPGDAFTINYPELDPAWNFDFGDHSEVAARPAPGCGGLPG